MRRTLITLSALLMALTLVAQSNNDVTYKGVAARRSEFMTYSTRNAAEKGNRAGEKYYIDLTKHVAATGYSEAGHFISIYEVEIPLLWRDRTTYLHIEGGEAERLVRVNGRVVGESRDNRTPSEFDISKSIRDGVTRIEIINPKESDLRPAEMITTKPSTEQIFLYSQPPFHIHDFSVSAKPDKTQKHGELKMEVVVNASVARNEKITIGYDIYSPEKELKYYDVREIEISGAGLDTLNFDTNIYGAMERLWSAESPKLYEVTLYLKRGGIILEYLCFNVGFGETTFADGKILRNGTPIDIKAAKYNSAATQKQTSTDLKALKKSGINTIYPDYPQPYWFYDLCDEIGLYIVEQANINTDPKGGDRSRKGTLANNPLWLNEFLERMQGCYFRVKNHPSIIAWSLGGPSGNGYNMYKCYEWFKTVESDRPIVYSDGEWNSDVALPAPVK
jgi:beta-galactosidase